MNSNHMQVGVKPCDTSDDYDSYAAGTECADSDTIDSTRLNIVVRPVSSIFQPKLYHQEQRMQLFFQD